MLDIFLNYGFFGILALYGAGAFGAFALGQAGHEKQASVFAHVYGALGGAMGLAFGLAVLLSGTVITAHGTIGIALDAFTIRIDALGAFFITIISTIALAASVFGISYQKQFYGRYRVSNFGFFYNMFLGSLCLVVAAGNGLLFLFAWELMAITSYFLVVFERHDEHNVRAGTLYILISQLGVVFLFGAFLILYGLTGSWDFEVIRASAATIPSGLQTLVLAFALIGLSAKAGVIPLHIWLPEAHPAAPSHVSALMSGVMIKMAIFMLIRFFIDFFPETPAFWGLAILALGAISSLLGVLYALSEHDIKRLLAFHSVENIGIILLGVGASITFFAYGAPALGIAALVAALYHTVNHALFKALLFLSAGSVVAASGTRNMEEYGGLIKVMPWTAVFFLIGAIGISGLPPLNGFVSEWLTFQGLFAGIMILPLLPKLFFLMGAASLALTGGLAAACFVKAFGVIFLARPRGHTPLRARESALSMRSSMGFLAALVVLFGVAASFITPVLLHIAGTLRGLASAPIPAWSPWHAITFDGFSALSMTGVTAALVVGVALTLLITALFARRRSISIAPTWDCGSPLSPRMEITATSFSRSIITIFKGLLRPTTQTEVEYHDATMRYFAKSKRVYLSLPDLYRTYLYQPAALLVERGAAQARQVQTGNLNTYLLYILLTLMILLFWALR